MRTRLYGIWKQLDHYGSRCLPPGRQQQQQKCETCLFTTSSAEKKWEPQLFINDTRVPVNNNPKFLGLIYDKSLTFNKHMETVITRMEKRNKLLMALRGTEWGWEKNSLRSIYIALIRSIPEYAGPAWTPWISKTNIVKLERLQLKASRIIGTTVKSCPNEVVLLEAGLYPLKERFESMALLIADRWNTLDEEDIRKQLANKQVRHRLKRTDWRSTTSNIISEILGTPGKARPARRDTQNPSRLQHLAVPRECQRLPGPQTRH